MNVFDWIIIGGIGGALILIGGVVKKKWKQLLLLDVEAMPRAQLKSKKYQLIEERLQRKLSGARGVAKKVSSPVSGSVGKFFRGLYDKLVALERKYRHASIEPKTLEQKEKTRQKIAQLLEKGETEVKAGNYTEAENLFLDVVRLNPKEVGAYIDLAEVYLEKKEHDHAIEALEYAKKLTPDDDRVHYTLGKVYESEKKIDEALKSYTECVRCAPKNPRNLSALLECAIELKDTVVAKETLSQLQEVNPENQKIEEFQERIRSL